MKYTEVLEAIQKGTDREAIISSLVSRDIPRRRAAEIYREYKAKFDNPAIQISEKYTWNKETDKYVIPLKCRKAPLVISGAKHRAICRDYSAWHGDLTAHDICVNYSLTPEIFNEYRRIFNLTKEREPLSAEEAWENDEDESVELILEQKRYSIYQKYEKEDWHRTQKDAEKWRAFEARQLDPFSRFLDSWSPPKYTKAGNCKIQSKNPSKQVAVINVSDIHVGAKADERFLYRQRNWRHADLQAAMQSYFLKIEKEIGDRKNPPNSCVVNMAGDILHTLTGYTDHGTKLDYEFLGEDQLEFAFALLTLFFNNLLSVFPKISVKSVSGNHSYFGDYTIARMLEIFYKNENRIEFEITSKRYLPYKILDTLIILEHGATGKGIKSKSPRGGAAKENYIKSILLDKPEMLIGTKSRIAIQGDTHHYEHIEKADFDMIICPSIVGGDLYSDFNGWKSRPAQCVFIIDEDGLKETIRFYFD